MKTLEDLKNKGIELNSIYNCDCLEAMKLMPDKSVVGLAKFTLSRLLFIKVILLYD